VVDAAGKPVGVLGRRDLIRAIKQHGPDARVADATIAVMPVVGHRTTLEQAFKLLQLKQAPAVGITDASGKLIGLVTGETIAEMVMLSEAMPRGAQSGPWGRPAGA
jgi:stage IV sporulation protein FB